MTNDSTKISFIPKNSLIGQDPFLARRRPRSFFGVVATIVFFGSIVLYVGLYAYQISLGNQIKTRAEDIARINKEFKESKVIAQAKVFQARTQIGKEILAKHVMVSPLFKFIGETTLQSVLLESFDFKHTDAGSAVLLKGETSGYASLAYQSDVLKKQNEKLLGFVIRDVKLTPLGSVAFSLEEVVTPSFISYTQNFKDTITVPVSAASAVPESSGSEIQVNVTPDTASDSVPLGEVATMTAKPQTSTTTAPKASSLREKFFDLFK